MTFEARLHMQRILLRFVPLPRKTFLPCCARSLPRHPPTRLQGQTSSPPSLSATKQHCRTIAAEYSRVSSPASTREGTCFQPHPGTTRSCDSSSSPPSWEFHAAILNVTLNEIMEILRTRRSLSYSQFF